MKDHKGVYPPIEDVNPNLLEHLEEMCSTINSGEDEG